MKTQQTLQRGQTQNMTSFDPVKQNENVQLLLDSLRDNYITYKEYAMRCNLELRTQSQSEAQKYFYFPPKIPQLDDPEKQKAYRKKYIQDVTTMAEPEPLVLIADSLHKELLETIGDRSNPSIMRQDLALFYKRRLTSLQHKKYKILNRWANQIMCLGRLQQEIDLALNRAERLQMEDNYQLGKTGQRPHPTAKEEDKEHKPLYLESKTQSVNSLIRLDDVETYLRIQTYRNKIFRLANKLVTDIKWLPYSSRFDIWGESRAMILDFKEKYNQKKYKIYNDVSRKIKRKLELNGVNEDRVITSIIDKFTKHLKGQEFVSRQEQILNSHICNYETPPIIVSNVLELKIYLLEIAKDFGITGDVEIDNGHSFTYQVQVFFPTHFQKQVIQLQFDWFDTSPENDWETIDKLSKNLGLNKTETVNQMSKFSEIERKKSILGRINLNDNREMLRKGIDKKRFDNIEFFTLDETDYKLKKADWLHLICFQGFVSESIKRQSNYLNQTQNYDSLLESAFNFLDVNDGGAVNKIIEESSLTHAQRATKRNQVRSENNNFKTKEDEIENNLKNAVQKADQFAEQIKIAEQPLLEPIPTHVVKAYYTMRHLKSRDHKIKLLHILNYFRSVQKRLAFDVQQFCSRDRAIGDMEIINPQFGKDQNGNPRNLLNGNNGPGNIFQNHISRKLDDPDNDKSKVHPVSIKSLKYNRQYNPKLSSTCPCVPIFHVSFGRPKLFESLSETLDNQNYDVNSGKDSRQYLGRQDRIEVDYSNMDVTVFDEYGIKIIYEESLNDILDIEEELIKIGSFFIAKHEFILDSEIKEPASAIDRAEMTNHLICQEAIYQFEKVQLIQHYLETYEHVYDPLEQVRIIQMIVDTMSQRPRLNLEATYFLDSYKSEIEVIKQKAELFRELKDFSIQIEEEENEQVLKQQELKYRKEQDHMNQKFVYDENKKRVEKVGGAEDEMKKAPVTDKLKDRLEQKGIVDPDKRQRMREIAQRHITEYANNQYMDFQDVLGIPEVTAEQLFMSQGQKEPLILDTLREHGFFQKQMDGYPWYFARNESKVELKGIGNRSIGILDFYESLGSVSKINAALSQSLQDLIKTHMPENGLAHSCLERSLLIEARGRMKLIRALNRDSEYLLTKSAPKIEEDLYFQQSDNLIFLMREFKSQMHPEQIYEKSNPLLIAKLDIESVSKFNFPRLKQSDIQNNEELSQDQIMVKMIDLAKISVVSMTQEEKLIGGNLHIEDFMEKKGQSQLPEVVNQPSMMVMSCNLLEVVRLREELIHRIYETDILSIIYKAQLKQVNKDNFKLVLSDSINFDTQSITRDNMNLIDYNDGSKMDFDLAFREFDNTLKANLDFKSESCLKALMTDLGVEELRAIVHYQIMQQQLLHVAVMINQSIIDGCIKGLHELDFLTKKKQLSVPNSVINLAQILSKGGDGYNTDQLNRERNKLRQILQREIGDHIYSINAKKSRQRPYIIKRYGNVLQKIQTYTAKPEGKLRILRSYRLKLLHNYCKDVLREVYQDSLKIQTLQTVNQLKIKQRLLPKDNNLFTLGLGDMYENLPNSFIHHGFNIYKNHQKFNVSQLLNNKFESLFYLPSNDEIMNLEARIDDTKELQLQTQAQFTDQINESLMDQQIKDLVKMPTHFQGYKLDDGLTKPIRKVNCAESFSYNSQSYKLLAYLTLIHRIYNLEYYMGRNNSPGLDVLELEDQILVGRLYWEKDKEMGLPPSGTEQSISDIVINRIVNQRRARVDLAEDLNQISKRLSKMNDWPKKYTLDFLRIDTIIELLAYQHELLFNQFSYGLEALSEIYLDKQNQECFQKINEVQSNLIRKGNGIKIYQNGFDLSLVNVHALSQNLNHRCLEDNQDFSKIYQPVIDEEQLVPMEITMIKNFYSLDNYLDNQNLQIMSRSHYSDYSYLENCFFNMKDSERAYIYTNFFQIDEMIRDYLTFKGVINEKVINIPDLIKHKLEFLNLKNEQKLLQNLLMQWIGKCILPNDIQSYEKLLRLYKDHVLMKILQERDALNELQQKTKERQEHKKSTTAGTDIGQKVNKDAMYDALSMNVQLKHMADLINERKAEINVVKRELEVRLIKHSVQMIKNEHSSLLATFEQAAAEKEVNVYVHPEQQYASTLYQSVDRNSHLDISTKLSFVQQFLTRLRNRCTEVETLTSGPGIVFSMKDFNECLQIFCKGLLKYGESELRTRIETQYLKENQYKHLIYLKDQQSLYYKRKCEAFLTDIDKLINSKLTQKGNQIIYELDISNRELRMLKDNFYLMEKFMRQELRHEYERIIQEKDNTIHKFKESFQIYKSELNNEIKEEVAKEILSLDKRVKNIVKKDSNNKYNMNSHRGQGNPRNILGTGNNFTDFKQASNQSSNGALAGAGQYHSQGYYDTESIKEINSLHKFIRKFKILTKMKEVLAVEKHERELHNQRQKLTSNECLWEQLAEAEKREQIIRQELYYTQQNLASYEKLIEKLQSQLETLNNQKLRLQQYKNSKSKRIEELESKMRDIEILENIDLNKVLEELRQRDKKLQQLQSADKSFTQKLDVVNKANDRKVVEMKKKYQVEKDMKQQAYTKLDNLRLEMRALEGRDFTNDLWKEKCKELFDICKDLQRENDELKSIVNHQQQEQIQTIQNMQGYQQVLQSNQMIAQQTLSPLSMQDKIQFPIGSNIQTTKPSSAAGGMGIGSRVYSRGGQGFGALQNFQGIDPTMTSGLSFPDINPLDDEKMRQLNSSNKKGDLQGTQFQTQSNFQNNKKSREMTLKGGQGINSDLNMVHALTSTGTMSDQNKKYGQTGFSNFGHNKQSFINQDVFNSGLIGTAEKELTTMTSGEMQGIGGGFRNHNQQVFGSHITSKSQNRGTGLVKEQQSKFKQKRLKTSQGGRRPNDATQYSQGTQIHQFQDQVPIRKSGNNLNFQRSQNLTAANLVGQQIAHGLIAQSIPSATNMFKDNRGSINLNINFNTTHISMPKKPE